MSTTVLFLESYVESTSALPTELHRIMATIKSLDERCNELMEGCKRCTESLLQIPPPGARKSQEEQVFTDLQQTFKEYEKLLTQFCEEKVQLAQKALDLIAMHQTDLDTTLEQFEQEMASVPQAPQQEAYDPFNNPAYAAATGTKGRGRGNWAAAAAADQWDTLEPMQAPALKRMHVPANKGKRMRDEAGINATAAVLSEGQEAYGMAVTSHDQGGLMAPLQFQNHAATANLLDSAPQPQLPGRLLTVADIRLDLKGRQAEMFWPDDNMWYLIEIHRVNVADKTATIVYRTGEVEDLNLQEIANEGHMSLIDLNM